MPGSQGERELQRRVGSAARANAFYDNQVLDRLNEKMCTFIGRQEFVFVATADASGNCDCSFRAGLPGFVRVLDDRTLAYPEYRGNGVMASLGNIVENRHVGLLFVDFFRSTVGLHVNGSAQFVENADLRRRADLPDAVHADLKGENGRTPERWVLVDVEEAFIHCSKHVPLMQKLDKAIHWGTDDPASKGGDYFHAKESSRQRADLARTAAGNGDLEACDAVVR